MAIAIEDFITALNFPESPEDEEGFAALRRAMRDRRIAELVQASQDILTLLSQDGIYMDDLFRYAYWLSGDRAVADDLVARKGERTYTDQTRDLHESAGDYMATVAAVYGDLAASGQPCPWITLDTADAGGRLRPPADIAAEAWSRL